MAATDVLGLLGGLALFLYGMRMMGEGMELIAGSRLKTILERLTRNRFLAVLVGLLLTAVIQSSNAMTAMTVGFVNAGLMEFPRAIGVIMGANIGTTVTGQLIALNVTQIAPIFAFTGVILFLFSRKKRLRYLGQVLAGLGILFMGMETMSSSMAPLRDVAWFQDAMVSFRSPILGILAGAAFTALVQSSSASVGVMQAMAMQGLIGLDSAIYVLCGQNIGCTIAAFMAAAGGSKAAKRTAMVHLLFNVIGTVLMVAACQLLPFVSWVEALTPGDGAAQIANAHTIFNLSTTAILLPCANLLARLAERLVPGEEAGGVRLLHIQKGAFGAASLGLAQIDAEMARMHGLARANLRDACAALFAYREDVLDRVDQDEETIDFLNKEITDALVRLNAMELTHRDADIAGGMYHVVSDIERVGDHAENIAGYARGNRERQQAFSAVAAEELRDLTERVFAILDESYARFRNIDEMALEAIEAHEQAIDDLVVVLRDRHIARLNRGECSADLSMVYVEIVTDLERVADHALNIAQAACDRS